MKMNNEIRRYLAIAIHVACETDEPSDDQLDSIVASATCALAMIKQQPRGARAVERVTAEVKARMAAVASGKQQAS